ncbi:hypothetical protein [Polyangium aurulentum]|uniref:hypothetical protein n=1 Tax=Polyangium aurulentum TaxID=2567896 RepID=UPI0010ADE66F|nr:hypothetical protein [Polyangium aurulentum]UQA59532.1 hypothetical protein E8A73_003190 [Polyangium aurulentum]
MNTPPAPNVAKRARRLLAGMVAGSLTERVYPEYLSFERGERPTWWKDDIALPAWGTPLGVHEYEPNTRARAFLVTEMGLALFGEGDEVTWLHYTDIAGWGPLSKEPVSMSLHIKRKNGERIEFPFPRVGQAFAFVQFIGRAIWEHEHAKELLERELAREPTP